MKKSDRLVKTFDIPLEPEHGRDCGLRQWSLEFTRTSLNDAKPLTKAPWWSVNSETVGRDEEIPPREDGEPVKLDRLARFGEEMHGVWWCNRCGKVNPRYFLSGWGCNSCGVCKHSNTYFQVLT